jgi:hypothetical protein
MSKTVWVERPWHLAPRIFIDELLRLGSLDPNWLVVTRLDDRRYQCNTLYQTWIKQLWKAGSDGFGMWALSTWLVNGPKVFRPSAEQCQALEQIEVRLPVDEYAQPYPALLIDLPKERYAPFTSVLCHFSQVYGPVLTCSLFSEGNMNDIVTAVAAKDGDIERSLGTFDDDCASLAHVFLKALRVAVNACLALVNYGSQHAALFPHEERSDVKLAAEDSERGQRARERLKTSLQLVTFKQEVKLHKTEGGGSDSEGTGGEKCCHWRRGHWHSVPHGPQRSLRKRVLYPPVLVRGDKFIGERSATTVLYK